VIDYKCNGGERGIRTPDTRKGIHAFEARAFSHSAISPHSLVPLLFYQGSWWLPISAANSLNGARLNLLTQAEYAVCDLVHILATSGSVIWVQGGTNVGVSELDLHLRRVCFFLAIVENLLRST
jgi:hypothetical protein